MFKLFTQLLDTRDTGAQDEAPPVYRCDLISGLRDQHKAILGCLERIAEGNRSSEIEKLQKAFVCYSVLEAKQLYPFLQHYARHFETDNGEMIGECLRSSEKLGRLLGSVIDRVNRGEAKSVELVALQHPLRKHFRHLQTTIYPLYHRYGIQLMRIC